MATEVSTTRTFHSNRQVVIVGGGPAGLATALILARQGWLEIKVLEQRPSADDYEPNKSYNYLIDGRGQKLTDALGLTEQLAEIGVPSTEFYLTQIKPDGSRKTSKVPTSSPDRKTAYWLPRRSFLSLLFQEIERHWSSQITILFQTKCLQINRISQESDTPLKVFAEQAGTPITFVPSLLVGCDGLHSLVRQTLQTWEESESERFKMQLFPSPSSGLKYKVLTLPPKFPLEVNGKDSATSSMAYAIRGVWSDRHRSISLGLLPIKDPDASRPANIIRYPEHPIWQLDTPAAVSTFLAQAFPQLPLQEMLSPTEIERFATSEGGLFPAPQYCPGLHYLINQPTETTLEAHRVGIVLLGDAIHCFPPDIGQGVNSALEDVWVLNQALNECNNDLAQALPLYELRRSPDIKALIQLAQTAYPWQYNQDLGRKRLWFVNFILRLFLSRVLPVLFSPPAFLLIQDHQLSYQQIWNSVQRTTRNLYLLGLLVVGLVILGLQSSH